MSSRLSIAIKRRRLENTSHTSDRQINVSGVL